MPWFRGGEGRKLAWGHAVMLKFLLKIPIYLFFFRTGRRMMVLTLLSLVGLILFCNLGPQKFKLSPIQSRIGEELVRQAVDRFPWDKDVGLVMMISDREAGRHISRTRSETA